MNVLIAYYSKTGKTEKVASAISRVLGKGHSVKMVKVRPQKEMKAHMYRKNERELPLWDTLVDVKGFDLVVVGTPVWGFCPTPIILSYLRKLKNTKKKKFALFATCTALPGTTLKRMGNILSTKGGKVEGSLAIRSVFDLDEEKLGAARRFAEGLAAKK